MFRKGQKATHLIKQVQFKRLERLLWFPFAKTFLPRTETLRFDLRQLSFIPEVRFQVPRGSLGQVSPLRVQAEVQLHGQKVF